MPLSETSKRIAVAAAGIPVVVGAAYLGGWVLAVLLAVAAVLGALEFYRMAAQKRARPLAGFGAAAAAAFVLLAALAPERGVDGTALWPVAAVLLLGALVAAIWTRGVEGEPLLSASTTLFGALYTGGTLAYALFLRHFPGTTSPWQGVALLFVPVLLTWANDTFAWLVGRRFGRRKLIPKVSPGKTVEGSVGALVGTALVAVGYAAILRHYGVYSLGTGAALLLGLVISVGAQVGDLAESLLKRDAGVKDSGALLPGHGGALDRIDSLLFTLPIGYAFFRLLAVL
jgi:phosphatidate cytidylyltransferase